MSLESESLLAVTGVIKPRINESLGRMAEVPGRIATRVQRWLASTGPARPWTPPPYHDPQKLRERFVHTPDTLEGVDGLDEVLAAEWVNEVAEARASLTDRWPGIPMRGGITAIEPPLSHDAAQDWLALVAIAEDPLRLVDDLDSGAALPAHVDLFAEVYPELMIVLTKAVMDAVVALVARGTELPEAKERGVRMVLGTPEDEPVVTAAPETTDSPKSSSAPADSGDTERLQTVAQRSGA